MAFRFNFKLLFIIFLFLLNWNLETENGFAQECNIIYVSPTGASSGLAGTISNPASLPYGFTLASITNNQIRLAVGNYTISYSLPMISGITMDGGFDPANGWKKTNSLHTVIYRDSTHVDTVPNRIVAVECSNISNFSIHDITIIINDAVGNSVSTYGIHIYKCSSYDISRMDVTAGNATNGYAGVAGANGVNGANGAQGQPGDDGGGCCTLGGAGGTASYPGSSSGGKGGDGGPQGTGFCFSGSRSAPDGLPGQTGLGVGGGAGGTGGFGHIYYVGSLLGCAGTPANDGMPGTIGANGAISANGANGVIAFARYFVTGDGQTGIQGVHGGGGGGGGGGGAKGGVSTCFGNPNGAGAGGGGGGEGGQGGFGATGGKGGGGSFGIYIDSNGVNSSLKDCLLNSGLQGTGGLAGTPGGTGGNGGFGGAGRPGCSMGGGGAGADGGKGGQGGDGGNGIPGVSLPLFEDPAGVAIAQADMRSTVEPAIYVNNGGCTFSDINYTTNATGIIQWFFDGGSAPLSGNGDSVMTQYSTMGRHSITLVVDGVPYMFTDFTGIFSDGTLVLPKITGQDTVCPGNTESYTATFPTSFSVLAYDWKMYNPGSASPAQTGTAPTFTYAFHTTVGKYMITLKTKSPCCGWSKLDTFYVNVVPFLMTDVFVSSSNPIICAGDQAAFFAVPLNGGAYPAYQWNVNGTSSGATTNSYLSSTFNNGDAITCIMTSSYPCPINSPVTSLPFIITVNQLPIVTCSSTNNYLGANTGFSENVSGGTSPYTYNWAFGDGGIDTAATTTHLYGGTGAYTYSVAVTDSNGCTGICTNTLNIVVPSYVYTGFTFNQTPTCGNTSVTFTDASVGSTTWWQWDFGDGSATSSLQNPIHIYSVAGIYSVKLISGNAIYSDTLVRPNIITVWVVPTANISYVNDTVCYPLSAQFLDISPGAASWLWGFGDGSPSSTLQNPSHKYGAPGTYNVTLTVNSINGCPSSATGTVYVLPSPTAAFLQNSIVICSGGTVTFTDASSVDAVQWNWNFGDGSAYTGSDPPTHIYSNQGIYNVSLTVENALGCKDDTTILAAVDVNLRPGANFQISPTENIIYGTEVSLENFSINYNSWIWDFGNGKLDSTNFNATAVYADPGVYTITLYAIYGPGCLDSMSIGITVNDIDAIYVPNAFTPNGDNINDVFFVYGNGLIEFKFDIFDRWGQVIFESTDFKKGWDGTIKGKKAEDGVYTYRISYRKNSSPNDQHTKTGTLLLLKEEF